MAAGSGPVMEFFLLLQLFKHTLLNIFKQAVGPGGPTDLQHLCCKALINK